jgi:Fur family ferric uptake transcriptional regulator
MKHQRDIRLTKQRKVIIDELQGLHSHPTADELYEIVRRKLPHISLGTVYRNLEFLAGKGIIRKLEIGGAQKRFDADLDNHQHIRCTRCGRIDDLPEGTAVTQCDMEVLESTGYEIIERRVEFIGICPDCGSSENEDGSSSDEGTDPH